jgi:hypothetical protein
MHKTWRCKKSMKSKVGTGGRGRGIRTSLEQIVVTKKIRYIEKAGEVKTRNM